MAGFPGETGEDAKGYPSPSQEGYRFAPRLLNQTDSGAGPPSEMGFGITSYPRAIPGEERARHRIVCTEQVTRECDSYLIVWEVNPTTGWAIEEVLWLGRGERSDPRMGEHADFQFGLDVKVLEVPDPVAEAEGEGEGRRCDTILLMSNKKGNILAFDGEFFDFLGAVNRCLGFVRHVTPYYAYGDEGARRLRVVASGRGGPCVWDFTDAFKGSWESGREPQTVHVLGLEGLDDDPSFMSAAYYETDGGGHRWGLPAGGGRGGIVAGTIAGHVRCWDPEGNRVMFDMAGGHNNVVDTIIAYCSSASGTTRLLTVGTTDGTAKVWETAGDSGALVLRLEDGPRTRKRDAKHAIRHACVFYGPMGTDRMAIGYVLGTVRVWDGEAVVAHLEGCRSRRARLGLTIGMTLMMQLSRRNR
jgi:hypothetical protein